MPTRSSPTLEQGDVFFFYRPKIGAEHVRGRSEVQRFYMVLAPEGQHLQRLFLLGSKRLPATEPHPRAWAFNMLTSKNPEDLRRELGTVEYPTKTRGERTVAAAKPIAEGRYRIVKHGKHTEFAYALELPKEPGPAQQEFELEEQASYVISVKNPDIATPGVPHAPGVPDYPEHLKARFGSRKWIDVEDPALLDYPNAELLLVVAHGKSAEKELGTHIDTKAETPSSADICQVHLAGCSEEGVKPLLTGEFPEKVTMSSSESRGPRKQSPPRKAPRRRPSSSARAKAPSRGRAAPKQHPPSAATIKKLLSGIEFPKSRSGLLGYAKEHGDRIKNLDAAVEVLSHLPNERYERMTDVAKHLPKTR